MHFVDKIKKGDILIAGDKNIIESVFCESLKKGKFTKKTSILRLCYLLIVPLSPLFISYKAYLPHNKSLESKNLSTHLFAAWREDVF
jgi:hypothetical protein